MTGIRFPGDFQNPILIRRDIPENRVGAVVTAMSMGFNGQKYGSKKPGSPQHSAQPPPPDCSQKGHCASLVFSTKLSEGHVS